MNRTIKGQMVRRYHAENHDQSHTHLNDFIADDNLSGNFNSLGGLVP